MCSSDLIVHIAGVRPILSSLTRTGWTNPMMDEKPLETISLNARVGAFLLAVCSPLKLILHLQGTSLVPLRYACWLGATIGVLCFCDEMGPNKPLNRAGLVLFAAAFCANTAGVVAVDPVMMARVQLLYAFTTLGAVLLWSVALMHRRRAARKVGIIGTAISGGAIALLIAAHLLLGTASVLGFSQLFRALGDPGRNTAGALTGIDALFCLWGLIISALLWTKRLVPNDGPNQVNLLPSC